MSNQHAFPATILNFCPLFLYDEFNTLYRFEADTILPATAMQTCKLLLFERANIIILQHF